MKTFIEIHALQNFAPSNLNRDDTGAPKDALFGGTRRARVSSQCNKRAVRSFFGEKQKEGFFGESDLAVRTKRVYQAIADLLKNKEHEPRDEQKSIAKAEIALGYVKLKSAEGGKSQYLLYLGQNEITALAKAIDQYWDQIVSAPVETEEGGKKKGKSKKDAASAAPKEVQECIEAIFNGGKAVDLALFGRMLADMPEKNQHAACQVAHAISTHSVEREFDFYTAVDDLKPEDSSGADMMGTVEFNSACFYRYAVVDWEKLVSNLQGDTELAAKGLRAFLEGFVIAEPTGKQNTFAAHNPPEFVSVSVRRNGAPRNLANAFEVPVFAKRGESLTKKSAEALVSKSVVLKTAFGSDDKTHVLSLVNTELSNYGIACMSLNELLDKTLDAIKE